MNSLPFLGLESDGRGTGGYLDHIRRDLRAGAADLFGEGAGYESAARRLGISREAARKWSCRESWCKARLAMVAGGRLSEPRIA